MTTAEYVKKIDEVNEKGPFKPEWSSLCNFEMPQWFTKAKFGIFIHWGIYSVPAYNNEWYSRNMYVKDSDEYRHHIETYGPHKDFGYKDFIPMFKAEKFDPSAWADLFKKAGAKYVVPVAEHHDGFQMYDSELSEWNAVRKGPCRDVIGELKKEIEKRDMVFATSSHRAEHQWFMGNGRDFESDICGEMTPADFYWPSLQKQPDQSSITDTPNVDEEYGNDWLARTAELIDKYHPAILYFDWWIQHVSWKPYLKKIAAYYYNCGLTWGQNVGICYKHDAMMFGSGIVDVERGKLSVPKSYHWQTDTAIAHNSWCYTTNLMYKTPYDILVYLIDIVSKNGNLLLNVGPRADGTIPEKDTEILESIGKWMEVNGEGIYNSRVWRFAEEGPTSEHEGQFSDGAKEYTAEDFRFTVGNGYLYAFCLKYPENGCITIKSLADTTDQNLPLFHGIVDNVEALGFDEKVEFTKDGSGLHIRTKGVSSELPVVFRITLR